MQLAVCAVEAEREIRSADENREKDEIENVHEADDAEVAAPLERAGIEHQRLAIVLAEGPGQGPEQDVQHDDGDAETNEEVIEALVVERAGHRHEGHEREVDVGDALAV